MVRTHARAIALPTRGTLAIDRRAGSRLRVIEGRVLLTETGFPDEIVLGAGEHYTIRGRGRVVVEALGVARLALDPLRRHLLPWRTSPCSSY